MTESGKEPFQSMEEILKQNLEPDEQIRWMGRPTRGREAKNNQMVRWIAMVVCLAAAVGITLFAMGRESYREAMMGAAAALTVLPILYAIQPILDQHILEKRTVYAVTDQRIITVLGETVRTLPREGLEWKVVGKEGSAGTIRFSGALYNKKKNDQIDAVTGIAAGKDRPAGLLFYQIDKVDEVCDLL